MNGHQARRLRDEWGEKPCNHAGLDRVYFGGHFDGYACIRCGKEFSIAPSAHVGAHARIGTPEGRAAEEPPTPVSPLRNR